MFVFLLLQGGKAYAQVTDSADFSVKFRANSTEIDTGYMENGKRIIEMVSFFRWIQSDPTVKLLNVTFSGSASPEGSYEYNKMLAKKRMEALEQLVRSKVSIPDSIVSYQDGYIDWEDLASSVAASDISHKEQILEILGYEEVIVHYYDDKKIDDRVLRLISLDCGKTWREMLHRFFHTMRNSSGLSVTCKNLKGIDSADASQNANLALEDSTQTSDTILFALTDTAASLTDTAASLTDTAASLTDTGLIYPTPAPAQTDSLVTLWLPNLYVKTNLLGWGLAISNAAVEIDLCRHFSFHLPLYYSAWNYFTPTVKFRTFALQPEVRYWFSGKRSNNDGLFAGVHFGIAYYNVAADGAYRTQDHDGTNPAIGGGLSVGYRMPISQDNRWKIGFSLGAGVYGLHYDQFRNIHNGQLVSTEKRTYFGIDNAAVTLSYTFGLKRKEDRL